jgi:aromatic ring-opening dioxygenase LigB subunit
MSKTRLLKLVITPLEIEVDDCVAVLLETSKLPLPWDQYQASIQVRCPYKNKDVLSRVFQIDFRNTEEFKQKLKTEVSKFKYVLFLYDEQTLRRMGLLQ